MALQLGISAKENKSSIIINECTGKYSGSNKGGWGSPNYLLTDVTKAQFEVYPPEVTIPIIAPVFPDFPTDDTELGYELLLSKLGLSTIESGVWKFGYRVNGTSKGIDFEKYTETRAVFTKSAECCVDKLASLTTNIPTNVFMKDDKKRASVELRALFNDACRAKECGNLNAAQTILKFINLQCECC